MSLHEILNPNTLNDSWKKLYVDSVSVSDSINFVGSNIFPPATIQQNSTGNLIIENTNNNFNVVLKTNGTGNIQLNTGNGFAQLIGSNYSTLNTAPLAINSSGQIVISGSSSGSFTPILQFGGSSTGITYLAQNGAYSSFGNIVFFSINIILSSKGSSVGVATVAGLPIPASGATVLNTANISAANNLFFATSPLVASIQTGSVINLIRIVSGASEVQLDDTNFVNNTAFAISGFYFTN